MAWNDTTLSTLETIARWEKEVNRLAGTTEHWGLLGISGDTPYTLTVPTSTASVVYTNSAGTEIASTAITAGVWTIPVASIVSLVFKATGGAVLGTSALNEGRGASVAVVYPDNTTGTLTLSNGSAWSRIGINRTWDEKLTLARITLDSDIATELFKRFPDYQTDTEVLDLITNPDTFLLACDLKALELIYFDLGNGGISFNQNHAEKSRNYANRYQRELSSAMSRMRLSSDGTGTGNRYWQEGMIVG